MNRNRIEVHAFCDASEKAYCAAIYIRSISSDRDIIVNLLTAKVVPLKTQSMLRFELRSPLLLASHVLKYLSILEQDAFAWTDSKVPLTWTPSEPFRWQTFISNRVSRIQETIPNIM